MPVAPVLTFTNRKLEPYRNPQNAPMETISFVAPSSGVRAFPKGTILAQVTASKLYDAYLNGDTSGLAYARGILAYDVVIDVNGLITLGAGTSPTSGPTGDEFGFQTVSVGMYVGGCFRVEDLWFNNSISPATGSQAAPVMATGITGEALLALTGRLTTGGLGTGVGMPLTTTQIALTGEVWF